MALLATDVVDYGYRKGGRGAKTDKRDRLSKKRRCSGSCARIRSRTRRTGGDPRILKRITEEVPQHSLPRQWIDTDKVVLQDPRPVQQRPGVQIRGPVPRRMAALPCRVDDPQGGLYHDAAHALRDQMPNPDGLHLIFRLSNGSQFIATDVAIWK
jgi:hypothetical protein